MSRRRSQTLDLGDLLGSWELSLRAERKSPQTVGSYGDGVRAYLRWCETNERPSVLERRQLAGFVDDLLASGAQPATARARQLGVRRFSAWLVEEGELDSDPLLGVKAPKLDTKVSEPLTDEQLKHPLISEGRAQRSLLARLLGQLRLPESEAQAVVTAAEKTSRARKAASQRWHRAS